MSKIIIIIINIIAFCLCVYDKNAAMIGARRVPEKVLLGIAAAFGSAGMLAGMYIFRHKTRHTNFVVLVPIFLVIHTIILVAMGIAGISYPILWLI